MNANTDLTPQAQIFEFLTEPFWAKQMGFFYLKISTINQYFNLASIVIHEPISSEKLIPLEDGKIIEQVRGIIESASKEN